MKKNILKLLLLLYKGICKIIRVILISFFLLIMFISIYALYDSYQIYDSVHIEEYLEETVVKDESMDSLISINKNIVGFITINDTSISYPILKGKDNIEYLNKNYKDEYSFSGSIFLDYRNNDFKEDYSIIYGHNLYRGGMFSDIRKYKDKKFFNTHLYGKLYTKEDVYDLTVVAYGVFKSNDEFIYNINKYNISYILNNSIIKNKTSSKKFILLSTCKTSSSPERIILLLELKKSS